MAVKYALMTITENGKWDFYADPLRATAEEVLDKIEYLVTRFGKARSGYMVKELNEIEQAKHAEEWKKYCRAID